MFCVSCALIDGNRRMKSLEFRLRPRMQKEARSKPSTSPAQPLLPQPPPATALNHYSNLRLLADWSAVPQD